LLPHDVYVAPLCCVTPLPVLSELLACFSLPRSVPRLLPAKLLMPLRQLAWWRILRLLMLNWLLSAPMKPAGSAQTHNGCAVVQWCSTYAKMVLPYCP
jgi:hypothetical protein